MTIPIGTVYPEAIDTNQTLYQASDSLRVRLIEDYNPGDKSIVVFGDEETMRRFNSTGIITLTEQCSEPELRAISFYYGSRTLTTFDELELLDGFTDTVKPKNITNVTQNVMALHHNNLKDALIAIEHMAGKKGETPTKPLEGTMEQRISYLRNLALAPKAWFSVDHTLGLAPFKVCFTDQSFRLGTDGTSLSVTHVWDFGDNTGPSIITIEEDEEVPEDTIDVLVQDNNGGKICKTYTKPGIYDVTLTVTNDFGTDSVTFPELITARFPAPDFATIEFGLRSGQTIFPSTGEKPYIGTDKTPPKIRASINTLIDVYIPDGLNEDNDNLTTNAGEVVDENNNPIDPIVSYTWSFSDDLEHNNSSEARASFGVGGIYDLILRADTQFGAYRITNYDNAFDIVENINLWLWTFGNDYTTAHSSEFGLISETFKTKSTNPLTAIDIDNSFLDGEVNEVQQKREFIRNNKFAPRGAITSGNGGTGMLFWATGRSAIEVPGDEKIGVVEYNGFLDSYVVHSSITQRPWNWIALPSDSNVYFLFGGVTGAISPNDSPTNQVVRKYNLSSLSIPSYTLADSNYKNGANELKTNEVTFDDDGLPEQGHMSVYRSTWHDDTGYFLRNEGVGTFFRIKSFYKTSGNTSEPVTDIRKLPSMAGQARTEGQLISLSQGVYFFSNSGSVAAYSPNSGVWGTGGPGINSSSFRLLQDTTILGFDDASQTLLAASDGDKIAYLSFDYSVNAFIKFNEVDTTFSGVSARPSGTQWQMSIF